MGDPLGSVLRFSPLWWGQGEGMSHVRHAAIPAKCLATGQQPACMQSGVPARTAYLGELKGGCWCVLSVRMRARGAQVLPSLLRKRFNRARIGLFLHSPFPSSEIFRTFPRRDDILRSLLNADLLGAPGAALGNLTSFARVSLHVLLTRPQQRGLLGLCLCLCSPHRAARRHAEAMQKLCAGQGTCIERSTDSTCCARACRGLSSALPISRV
jgi:hypothetical protein